MVMKGNNQNVALRISTHALEAELKNSPGQRRHRRRLSGPGHSFYKLHFPTATRPGAMMKATQQWHEDNWVDGQWRVAPAGTPSAPFALQNLGLAGRTGNLYEIDPNA